MNVTIQRSTLIKPLQMISGVVEKRQTLPILSNVLITMKDDILSLTATDLDIELIGVAHLEQSYPAMATTVSARKLLDICRALPEDATIQITLDKDHLLLRSNASRFNLTTLPAQEFPSVENGTLAAATIAFTHEFKVNQAKLRKLLSKVYFAMGHQDVRHYLNGALFSVKEGVVGSVATDGHRLAYGWLEEPDMDPNIAAKVILPRKSVLELMRLLDQGSDALATICLGDSHFRVVSSDFTFTTKLINAQYPDYERLIPKQATNIVTAKREVVKQALVRASILSNEKFRGIRIFFGQNLLRMTANNPEQEEAEESIIVEYAGAELEMGINAAYLLDVVSALQSEDIRFSLTDSNSGVLIEAADATDSLYVVMPMRL